MLHTILASLLLRRSLFLLIFSALWLTLMIWDIVRKSIILKYVHSLVVIELDFVITSCLFDVNVLPDFPLQILRCDMTRLVDDHSILAFDVSWVGLLYCLLFAEVIQNGFGLY